MTTETIHPDVSAELTDAEAQEQNLEAGAEEQGEGTEREAPSSDPSADPVSRREQKMAELHDKRKAEQAEQRKQFWLINNPEQGEADYDAMLNREAGEANKPPTAAHEELESAPSPTAAAPQAGNGWEVVNGVRVKTLMVNGQKRQLTEEQYDRYIQKDLAGDDKLRKAAEVEAELNRRKQFLDEQERRIQSAQPPKPDAGEALKQAIAKHTELLLEGDVDAANEQMATILSLGRDSSTPNIDVIASQAATRAVTEVERKNAQAAHDRSINEGWQTLLEKYQDVVSDPDHLAFADIQVKRLREENPDWTPAKVIIEAGKYTREKLKLKPPATPGADKTASTDLTAQRLARKASIKPLPNASSKRHEKKAPAPVDMSPAAKIARMRGGRAL